MIYGGLVAFAGLAVGAGMVALTEKAGVRSEERGALSYEVSHVLDAAGSLIGEQQVWSGT